jgi:hypothetical protein
MRNIARFLGEPCRKPGVSRLPVITARLMRHIVIAAAFAALAQAQGVKSVCAAHADQSVRSEIPNGI